MKNLFHLIICVVLITACTGDEPIIQEPVPPEPLTIDSIDLNLVNLADLDVSDEFMVYDFTTRIPGEIWGCTYLSESDTPNMTLFSYNLAANQMDIFKAPTNLGLNTFNVVEAGPDGILYMHSTGILHKAIAIYDTKTGIWSSIEMPDYVLGITIDEVNNILWIGHYKGVSKYQAGNLVTFDDTNSILKRITSGSNNSFFGSELAVDKAGVTWYANMNELYFYKDEEWFLHPLSPLSEQFIISHIVAHESDGVLIKVPQESLYHLTFDIEIGNYNSVSELVNPSKLPINLIGRLSDESIIYSHVDGLSYYDSTRDTIIQVDAANSLIPINKSGLKLDRDQEGKIWIGGKNILATLPDEW